MVKLWIILVMFNFHRMGKRLGYPGQCNLSFFNNFIGKLLISLFCQFHDIFHL